MKHGRHSLNSASRGIATKQGRHALSAPALNIGARQRRQVLPSSLWNTGWPDRYLLPEKPAATSPPRVAVTVPVALAGFADAVPASLIDVVAAATDPLEIAASLETCGLSNAVVRRRFGQRDVFSFAERLFADVEFSAAPATDTRTKRPGGLPDLGRGFVFAVPTIMFAGVAAALHSWLSWWTVPLALVCGWAFSQFVAYVGFSREAWGEHSGSTVIWALLGSVLSCISLGLLGAALLGGRSSGALFAAGACAFMVAAAELVVHGEERLIGVMIIPGVVGSAIFITHVPVALPVTAAVSLAAISVVGTVIAALRHVPPHWWRWPAVSTVDVPSALFYFANGCCCGLFVALFMVLEPADNGVGSWPAAAAYPMILSLGAMEWQLRSLRAGARDSLLKSHTYADFAKAVEGKLARSTLLYGGVLGLLTVAVQAVAVARGVPVPSPLLVAGAFLAIAFFLALLVASCGRVDLVLGAWVAGLAVYGALGLLGRSTGAGWVGTGAEIALCIATAVPAVSLAIAAPRVVANPVCHA